MLIGLTGKAGSGKDTVASHLSAEHGFRRIAFADTLKQMAVELDPLIPYGTSHHVRLRELLEWYGDNPDPWDLAKGYTEVRSVLQVLGVAIRQLDPGFWINHSGLYTYRTESDLDRVVVTDVRFENEVQAVKNLGGTVWRVVRPGAGAGTNAGHSSETALDNLICPEIDNSGTIEDLKAVIDSQLEKGVW